ncbi:MAG: DUF4266 domain-containing protein [Candidatus Eisenbacteria bacterium]|nr:DUF4266 domain-containing protein [Candidatus Eisenbacteria bacterium]
MRTCTRRIALAALCAALAALSAGCATVKPWDRDLLSQKKMQFAPSPMLNTIDDHVYFSKEGSTGGLGVAGGGCGCN